MWEGGRKQSKMAMQPKPVSSWSPDSLCRELPTVIGIEIIQRMCNPGNNKLIKK